MKKNDNHPGPMFSSMSQMSGATSVPLSEIRRAKNAGCEAFDDANRVRLYPVLRFIFENPSDGTFEDSQEKFRHWKAVREELAAKKEQGKLAEWEVFNAVAIDAMSSMFNTLRKFSNQMPPGLKGLSEVEIKQKLDIMNEEIEAKVRKAFDRLAKEKK
jgi:hypothetical protein